MSVKSGVSKWWIWRVEGYTLLSETGFAAAHYWLSSNQKYQLKFRRRTGDLCGFRMYVWAFALNLIMLMDVQYIHPPVSLASSCYQGILKIDLDMISYSSFHLCLRTSSRAALGNRIQGLSCGEAIVSLSGNGSASVHYCFFFDVYDSGNVTKRPCWRCWRLAVWECMYAPVLVPSKSLYWGVCRRHLVSFPIANFYKSVARDLWNIPVHGWSEIFRGLTTLFMILCTFSQTLSPIAMIEIIHGPRAWGGISWMGAVIRWYSSCSDMTTSDYRISQYLVDWIMSCLVIDIPILIILDPKPSFETLDLWALDLRSSTIGFARKANRS